MTKPVTLQIDINTTNQLFKDPPKKGDFFKVVKSSITPDPLWGSRVTLVLESASEEKLQLEQLRGLYYEEHCPHCNEATYPMLSSALFRCVKCHELYEKIYPWTDTTGQREEE